MSINTLEHKSNLANNSFHRYGRVFHHRVFLHQIIADLVIFHMSNRRLEENGYDTLPLITDAEAPCSIDSDPDDKENKDEDEDGEDGEDDEDEDNNDEEEEEEPKLDTPDTSKNDKKCYNSDQKSGYGKIEAAAESFCKSNLETNKDGPVFSNFRQTDKKTPPRSHHFIGTFEVFEGCEWEYSFDDCMRYFKAPVDRQL